MNLFARCRHLLDISATPIDVDSNILSYRVPLSLTALHIAAPHIVFTDGVCACFNHLTGTLKPQSINGPLYSNTVIGTLAVDGWAAPLLHLVQ